MNIENEFSSLLVKECARLESEADVLREQVKTATSRLRYVEGQLVHIRALLQQDVGADGEARSQPPHLEGFSRLGDSVCDIAVEVLRKHGRAPMYYKDLAEEVIRRGGALNGRAPAATLTARLVRDERFVRPTSKGYYALREDYPGARNVGARKRPHVAVVRKLQ